MFPFIVRPLNAEPWAEQDESACDLITPYGYGGAFAWNTGKEQAEDFWNQFRIWAAAHGIVTSFARLSLFSEQQLPFDGEVSVDRQNVVCDLTIPPEEIWRNYKHKVRKNVACAKSMGLSVEVDESGQRFEDFFGIYYSTMERRNADYGYFFPREFFTQLMRDLSGQYVFFHVLDAGRVVSTELVLISADNMYSFLGGTLADSFDKRPNELLKHEGMLWGRQADKQTFVLGGGYAENDGIFRYKKAFSSRRMQTVQCSQKYF